MSERALSTKYINFLNDWGFKYLFKREERKIEKLKLIFLQIPRISNNFENCGSELEQWIYLLKNITTMEYKSIGALKEEFQKILDLAKASALTDSEKAAYEESEKHYRDYVNTISYAEEKGIERGRTEGLEEGMAKGLAKGKAKGLAEGKLAVARAMKTDGLSVEVISKYTNLSIKEIEKL